MFFVEAGCRLGAHLRREVEITLIQHLNEEEPCHHIPKGKQELWPRGAPGLSWGMGVAKVPRCAWPPLASQPAPSPTPCVCISIPQILLMQ